MKPFLCLVALLVVWPTFAPADETWLMYDGCRWHFPRLIANWQQRQCWCPDDYCRKVLPCTPCNPKGCVDDYCRKVMPWVSPNAQGCADDYCPKKCPLFLRNLREPWYSCGPSAGCSKP